MTDKGPRPVTDTEHHRINSLAEKARSAMSNAEPDDHIKQAVVVAKDVATRAMDASKTVSRKVAQEDAWDELHSDVELLTEIARAHHALIIDLIDRVAGMEARAGSRDG
jgi:hypothetical protein